MGERHTSHAVKQRVIDTAVKLLTYAGCEVSQSGDDHNVTLDIYLPPDSPDPHGERLALALKENFPAETETSGTEVPLPSRLA